MFETVSNQHSASVLSETHGFNFGPATFSNLRKIPFVRYTRNIEVFTKTDLFCYTSQGRHQVKRCEVHTEHTWQVSEV